MKPSFALSLSFEGIGLLHRSFPGWNRVGEVALDSPDLAGALAVLRETAQQINGHELTSKLVIPNDQIKYLALDLGLTDEAEREAAIRRALDGATPYPVDDLVFDWSVEGDRTLVAAVARETLTEAEAFAADHGFGPMSFVAIPEQGQFSGEPFFGATRHAAEVLPEGETVQRDMAAIRVTGVARLPEEDGDDIPAFDEPSDGTDEADTAPEALTGEIGAEEPGAETRASETVEPVGEPETEADPEPDDAPEPEDAPAAETAADEAPEPEPDAEAAHDDEDDEAELPPDHDPQPDTAPELPDEDEDADDSVELFSDTLPTEDDLPVDAADGDEIDEDETDGAEIDDMAGTEPDEKPLPAFSTIRAQRDTPAPSDTPTLAGVTRGAEALTAPSIPIEPDLPEEAPAPEIEATPVPYADDAAPEDDIPPMPAVLAQALERDREWAEAAEEAGAAPAAAEDRSEGRIAFFSRRGAQMAAGLATGIGSGLAARKARRAEARAETGAPPATFPATSPAAPSAIPPDPESEKQRMTIFGARNTGQKNAAVGGKPRYLGLILTAILLLFLAGVAAWASIFVDEGLARFFGPRSETAVASLPADTIDELSVEGEEAMVPTPPEDMVETVALDSGALIEEATPPARIEPRVPHAMTLEEAQTRYAVTGVWLRAPEPPALPDQADLDDLYVASIDQRVEEHDAVALPAITSLRGDEVIARVATPAARGTTFNLDDRGLVIATAAGALSPEGFMVYAGRPPLVPAALPQRAEAPDTELSEALQRLAAIRPKPRPEGLVEENERQTLGGLTRSELGQIRPRQRPESAQELAAAEAERQRVEQAAEAAVAEVQDAEVQPADPTFSGTAQAVPVSIKPEARPRNFARIVEQAQQQDEQQETRVAAAVPRQQAVAPSIPSKSNVAKAATVRNQLNLRKINLIGVYGKPSSRRALVRLSNGRYKKVKVGDRLDGGRVQAIGDAELRYSKNGRNVILKMPRG